MHAGLSYTPNSKYLPMPLLRVIQPAIIRLGAFINSVESDIMHATIESSSFGL
jgi:hypothetical protein